MSFSLTSCLSRASSASPFVSFSLTWVESSCVFSNPVPRNTFSFVFRKVVQSSEDGAKVVDETRLKPLHCRRRCRSAVLKGASDNLEKVSSRMLGSVPRTQFIFTCGYSETGGESPFRNNRTAGNEFKRQAGQDVTVATRGALAATKESVLQRWIRKKRNMLLFFSLFFSLLQDRITFK